MSSVFWLLSVLSAGYFLIYAASIGVNNLFLLVYPVLALLFALMGILSRKLERGRMHLPPAVFTGGVLAAALILGLFGFVLFRIVRDEKKEPEKGADFCIVLGARVNGREVSFNLARRLDAAISYLEENPETAVIVSGGQGLGEEIPEAEAMEAYLLKKGIGKERILTEDRSMSTQENLLFCREMIPEGSSVVLATSGFHLHRAMRIARKMGYDRLTGLGAQVKPVTVPLNYMREVCAVVYYRLRGRI